MGKLYAALFLLIILISCQGPVPTPSDLDGRVLILGDSITQDGRYVSIVEYELFKHNMLSETDIISIGLSSETVSGKTEPNHPYPRPNVHERLGRALEKTKPRTVVACYGMNDGIYHPQSKDRFQAYKNGVQKLIEDVHGVGAKLVVLTPPIYDAAAVPEKVVGPDASEFGYKYPFEGYNEVLADYSEWLKTLNVKDLQVIDLNGPMWVYSQEQRKKDPNFAFSKDGVHPQLLGHVFMAYTFLRGIGVPVEDTDPQVLTKRLEEDELFRLVHERRQLRSMAWLMDIGHKKPGDYEALPVADAEAKAQELKQQILLAIKDLE